MRCFIFKRWGDINTKTRRHDGRSTLEIRDEYDVQDLLQGLLKIDFEIVRPEE